MGYKLDMINLYTNGKRKFKSFLTQAINIQCVPSLPHEKHLSDSQIDPTRKNIFFSY